MRRGSWVVLNWLPWIVILTAAVGWAATEVRLLHRWWVSLVPVLAWLVGLVLLAAG